MSENNVELFNYALAEAAATGGTVDGISPCAKCNGAGLVPSDKTLAPPMRFIRNLFSRWDHFAPVRYGVVICTGCDGTGVDVVGQLVADAARRKAQNQIPTPHAPESEDV